MSVAQVKYLGHSTFKLVLPDGRVVLIDPWLADNPSCPADEKSQSRCDIIAITHAHADHCSDVPALVGQHKPHVVASYELANLLAARAPEGEYIGMNIGGTCDIGGLKLSMTRAYHSSGYQEGDQVIYAGMPGGFVIEAPGLARLYHAGDTDVFSDMELIHELYQPQVIMLPIGDLFTMGPRGAALAAGYFDPRTIVPMHYGTFPVLTGTPDALRAELGEPLAGTVLALEPGGTATWESDRLS